MSGGNGATFDLTVVLRPAPSVEGMDRRLLLSYAYASTNLYVHGKGYLSCTFERCLERSSYLASVPSWKGILHSQRLFILARGFYQFVWEEKSPYNRASDGVWFRVILEGS